MTGVATDPGTDARTGADLVEFRVDPSGYRHWRLSFELVPGKHTEIELQAHLRDAQGRLSETWLYRWNP